MEDTHSICPVKRFLLHHCSHFNFNLVLFFQFGHHYNRGDLLLPTHKPEILDGMLERPLCGDERHWLVVVAAYVIRVDVRALDCSLQDRLL